MNEIHTAQASASTAAALTAASSLGLVADTAVVLAESNRLVLRLLPADVVARVEHLSDQRAQFEVDLAQRLAAKDSPVAALDRRVPPRVYVHEGFAVTFWTYYEPVPRDQSWAAAYANALLQLHLGMRSLEMRVPGFTDRVAQARAIVTKPDRSATLTERDRHLLDSMLVGRLAAIRDRAPVEQMLHGEPHDGNVLSTQYGPLFVDLETVCRGPVEFDLAHVPDAVSKSYPTVDAELLSECRALVLAMVAAWRSDVTDMFPDRDGHRRRLIELLRKGPPWPALDAAIT